MTGALKIRVAQLTDLPSVLAIENEAFSVPWREETFLGLLGREDVEFLVAELGRVVGYAVLWSVHDEAELANIAVASTSRGSGVGSELLRAALLASRRRGARRIFLEVRDSNDSARGLYRSQGFEEIGVRRRYYNDPVEDARVLAKDLREPPLPDGARPTH